jgi:polyhydroxyalkanoate synthesis regulator phasin
MSEITIEKTHKLLEKLADYVMNEVPTKKELLVVKNDVSLVTEGVNELREDVQNIKGSLNIILDGMDGQAQQLNIIRTEQAAFNHGFNRLEERVEKLEKVH